MSKDLSIKQLMEIEEDLNNYLKINNTNVSELFKRYRSGFYSARYVKNRVSRNVYNAIRKEWANNHASAENVSASHSQYNYPSTQTVLKDIYGYRKYMERNKNEDKNEDITTGI
tara:strand:- start:698 stop:1039 length:342 start_codon:yes stop_codon:yes gene_type:complete